MNFVERIVVAPGRAADADHVHAQRPAKARDRHADVAEPHDGDRLAAQIGGRLGAAQRFP